MRRIRAALSGWFGQAEVGEGTFIGRSMSGICAVRDHVQAAAATSSDIGTQRALDQAAIRIALANLRSFAFVADRHAAGALTPHAVASDTTNGLARIVDPGTERCAAGEIYWRS